MSLGEKLKEIRKRFGLSQEQLAEVTNVSRQAITKWENDTGIPDISNLQELSKVFGLTVDYLLNDDNQLEMKKFNKLSAVFSIELVLVVISVYPLLKFLYIYGIFIWAILFLITLFTSLKIEKFKNKYT